MRLFEITAAYKELQEISENLDASDEDIKKSLDECKGALIEKGVDVAKIIRNIEASVDAIKDAEEKMASRRKAFEERAKSIKRYLLSNMQKAEIQKIECPYFKISRQKNPPSIIIDSPDDIDIRYWKQPETPPPAIDKRAILDDIKNGVVVDGAHSEQTERLVIK